MQMVFKQHANTKLSKQKDEGDKFLQSIMQYTTTTLKLTTLRIQLLSKNYKLYTRKFSPIIV